MERSVEPVTLINPFEVPANADEDFIARWEKARDFLREQPGYVETRLHRSLRPDARFRFVNIALWDSPRAFQQAMAQPQFREGSAMPYPANPALYAVVRR